MRFGRSFLGLLIALLLSIWFPASAEPEIAALEQGASPAPPKDILLVLDNSGSMKQNDPKSLMREVVSSFARQLPGDARFGLVLFDEKVRVALGLTGANAPDFKQKVEAALKRIDYRGQRTDIPAGVERGIYELRQQRRPEAKCIIIFLTDGIVDLGSEARNIEQARWLRGSLADQAKALGIPIFGIAFTEEADFQLIQSVAQTTGGEYYRVLAASDIPATFEQVRTRIEAMTETGQPPIAPVTEPSTAQAPSPAPVAQPSPALAQLAEPKPESAWESIPTEWRPWLIIALGLVVLGMVSVVAIGRSRRAKWITIRARDSRRACDRRGGKRYKGVYGGLVLLGIHEHCTPALAATVSAWSALLSSFAEVRQVLVEQGVKLDVKGGAESGLPLCGAGACGAAGGANFVG